MCKMQG